MTAHWKISGRTGLMSIPVLRAFLLSLTIHGLIVLLFLLGQALHLDKLPFLRLFTLAHEWLFPPSPILLAPPKDNEIQLTFVEVDPTLAVKEPPKDAKYYSAVSTEAANRNPQKESPVPNLEGEQEKFLKLTENERKSQPLQPTPQPSPQPAEKQEPAAKPKEKQQVGDLALVKPEDKKEKNSGKADSEKGEAETTTHERPRTLAEAKAAASRGAKSKIEGGVARLDSNSLAARGTLLGDYDARFVDAVRQCWYDLMYPRTAARAGKVVLEFQLHFDGRVTDVRVTENQCGEVESALCEAAITKPAPFEKWPVELRRELKGDTREVRFTFYYE